MRGLGPRLVLGLVNGREVASSEPSRNVRWEIYPSEVVAGVDVYKAQSADLVAGGVAGTIDIKTIRPLDYTGPDVLLRGGAVYYEAGSDIPGLRPVRISRQRQLHRTPRATTSRSTWVSACSGRRTRSRRSRAGASTTAASIRRDATGDLDGDGIDNPTPWGAQTEVKKLTEDRFGLNAAMGLRVGDNFEMNIDALYSKFTIDEDQNQAWYGRNNIFGNWGNGNAGCYNDAGVQLRHGGSDGGRGTRRSTTAARPVTNVIAQVHRGQGPVRHRRQLQGRNHLDHDARSVVLESEAHEPLGGVPLGGLCGRSMTFDMSAGNTPSCPTSVQSRRRESAVDATGSPGSSDGPDNLKDKLTALRRGFRSANSKAPT